MLILVSFMFLAILTGLTTGRIGVRERTIVLAAALFVAAIYFVLPRTL